MIKVLFFGPVAERAGTHVLQHASRPGLSLQDMRAELQQKYPAAFELVCFVAVNGAHEHDGSRPLYDGDEVVFMSKFSGG